MAIVPDLSGNNPTDQTFPHSTPLGDRQVSVTTTAQTLAVLLAAAIPSLTIPNAAKYAVIGVENFNIRWTADGSIPTQTYGELVGVGAVLPFVGNLQTMKLIGIGGTAVIDVSLYDRSIYTM